MRMKRTKQLLLLLFLICSSFSFAQIKAGKIVFERKTNLEKVFKDVMDDDFKDYIKKHKFKEDSFELVFNDTCFIFKPIVTDLEDDLDWATNLNTTYQSNKSNSRVMIANFWSNEVYVKDTITPIIWKITDSKRTIGKYECRKAIWEKNDSTRIYAWYSSEIISNAGPEGMHGLPGTILGLATEDGGVVYFAKYVEILSPTKEDFYIESKRKKFYTYDQLRIKFKEDYGNEDWGKNLFESVFEWQ